jgi:hypothetical protein
MPSRTEIEAASRAYLNHEPEDGEEVWSRVRSAMASALEAAEKVRARATVQNPQSRNAAPPTSRNAERDNG